MIAKQRFNSLYLPPINSVCQKFVTPELKNKIFYTCVFVLYGETDPAVVWRVTLWQHIVQHLHMACSGPCWLWCRELQRTRWTHKEGTLDPDTLTAHLVSDRKHTQWKKSVYRQGSLLLTLISWTIIEVWSSTCNHIHIKLWDVFYLSIY